MVDTAQFHIFTIPFIAGMAFVIGWLVVTVARMTIKLPSADKLRIIKNFLSLKTIRAIGEIASEVLIHRRIWRENKLLGFMHMSFAFGWFMLIVTGWVESTVFANGRVLPIWQHIFFNFFYPGSHDFPMSGVFVNLMDFWLLLILSGQIIAFGKRLMPHKAGIAIKTRHARRNRVALTALWFIFPLRLLAESTTVALHGGGGFLTGTVAQLFTGVSPTAVINLPLWWAYSVALCVFMCAIPFTRYLHIPIEAFLILARHWRIADPKTINQLEIMACSACGLCLSNCPLARNKISPLQPVYFIERLRQDTHTKEDIWQCLQCGRCQQICPVRVHSNNIRQQLKNEPDNMPLGPNPNPKTDAQPQRVVLFSGCMGKLTRRTQNAMNTILEAAKIDYTWVDEDRNLCCGRPLRLNGQTQAANNKLDELVAAIGEQQPDAVVTTCPICYNMMKGHLGNTPLYHHTDFIKTMVDKQLIHLHKLPTSITYHDPCELSRTAGMTKEPLAVLGQAATLKQPDESGAKTRCCGGALAAIGLTAQNRMTLADETAQYLQNCHADSIVTACPLCKKTIAQRSQTPVADFAEVVAAAIKAADNQQNTQPQPATAQAAEGLA